VGRVARIGPSILINPMNRLSPPDLVKLLNRLSPPDRTGPTHPAGPTSGAATGAPGARTEPCRDERDHARREQQTATGRHPSGPRVDERTRRGSPRRKSCGHQAGIVPRRG
jgi:hypothetical protein